MDYLEILAEASGRDYSAILIVIRGRLQHKYCFVFIIPEGLIRLTILTEDMRERFGRTLHRTITVLSDHGHGDTTHFKHKTV